jgi:lipopolysaccharide transport system permease protein
VRRVKHWRRHVPLTIQLAKREVSGRYRGSMFGFAWSLINPLVMLLVYGFVFSLVLRARWPGVEGDQSPLAHGVLLLSGLMLHGFLAECLTRAPGQIVGNANFVKKVVFPLPVIAVAQWAAATFHLGVNLAFLLVFQWMVFGAPPATVLMAPIALLPLLAVGLGLMWTISAVSVYFRDLGQIVGVLATLLLFLSPALYPMEQVPAGLRPLMYLNPLTPALEQWRALALWGTLPSAASLFVFALAGGVALAGGAWCFSRLRRGFADVL